MLPLREKVLSRGQRLRNAPGVDFEAMEAEGHLKVVCLYPEAQSVSDQSPDDPTIG